MPDVPRAEKSKPSRVCFFFAESIPPVSGARKRSAKGSFVAAGVGALVVACKDTPMRVEIGA